MPSPNAPQSSDFRNLLDSTGTCFVVSRFAERAVVFCQGDQASTVLHIETGRIRLAVTTPGGQEAICGILGPGAFLGEEVLNGHPYRRQTAVAMTATEVIVVAKDRMTRLLHARPEISDRFLAHVIARQMRLEEDLLDQLLHSGKERLARALILLAGCDGQRPCGCAMPHVSQDLIAEMVGTTRSRVNSLMGKFKKLGFIEEDGGGLRITPALMRVFES